MKDVLEKKIKRGKESWTFIYFAFGIFVAFSTFLLSIIPVDWTYKVVAFLAASLLLIYLCLCSAWFQNKLIGLKIWLEETWRTI